VLGGDETEAGRRRLLPLHGSLIGEAGRALGWNDELAVAEMNVADEGREVRVLRRPGEDEQGLAAPLFQPGSQLLDADGSIA
jgi:hypothetical protein